MKRILVNSLVIAMLAALMVTGTVLAQDKYPSKPVSGIVPASISRSCI